MSRIPPDAVARAVEAVQAMDRARKAHLADEIFRSQPNMLASVLALHRVKVPTEKMAFALEMLFICFLAMRASGLSWPLITG